MCINISTEEAFYWHTYTGAKLDLFTLRNNKRLGFEFKRTSSPALTSSIKTAQNDLQLSHVYVIYPGNKTFPLANNVTAMGLTNVLTEHF